METLSLDIHAKTCKERLEWLIKLRWIAGIMVLFVIMISIQFFKLPVPNRPLYFGVSLLFFYNLLFQFYVQKLKHMSGETQNFNKAQRFANIQISIDLILLSYFIHFSGGLENPFIFYFIFHMVIASILLTPKAAYIQASLAVTLLLLIGLAEGTTFLPHYHLSGFLKAQTCQLSLPFTSGILFIIGSTLYLTVFMTTSIEQQLRQRETDLALANEKLADNDRLKSQYVLTVSHDLQSSLSTIQSCLTVVLDNLAGSIPDKAREMITRAEQRAETLNRFVKDLLNLSRIRALKELEKKQIPLEPCIRKTLNLWQMQISEKSLILKLDIPILLQIHGNQKTFEELFSNLIGNAIRYTPCHGNIHIQAKQATEPGFVSISVSDTGIGIDEKDKQKIFNDFYRAKNAEILEKNGTGLGLSIVKQIVEAHDGQIWVESELGRGTTFFIKIPQLPLKKGGYNENTK